MNRMKRVLIFGSFDLLHPGHLFLIHEAQKYGAVHAGLALDATILAVKGREPYNSLALRMKNLEAFGVIPHAGHHTDRLRVVRDVAPDTILLGYDQHVFVEKLEHYIESEKSHIAVVRVPPFSPDIYKSKTIRSVVSDKDAGFLLIDKPTGEPSLATVSALRRSTGIQQIGFSGTLDPLATGLLICGISEATRLLDWFHMYPKTYEANMRLGVTSDTYDSEGVVTDVSSKKPAKEEILTAALSFLGESDQVPPMFSAKKVRGKKLYELARAGKEVQRSPRAIIIDSIEILSYEYPSVTVRVTCSAGTYIRSLIHDIGAKLGTGAIMFGLRRTAIGPYSVASAGSVNGIDQQTWRQYLVGAHDVCAQANRFFYNKIKAQPRNDS